MKKFTILNLLVFALFIIATNAFAFSDVGTHPDITKAAVQQSLLKSYLNDHLGFKNGLGEIIFSKKTVEEILSDGARTEDTGILNPGRWSSCDRGLNHFFDPSKSLSAGDAAGLHDVTKTSGDGVPLPPPFRHWDGKSNLLWAVGDGTYSCSSYIKDDPSTSEQKSTDCNAYSWRRAREAFYFALRETNVEERNKLFARMFRSVGQVTHLLQDMAVPAHVRNDMKGHLNYQQIAFNHTANWFGNNFESYVQKRPGLVAGGESGPNNVGKLTDFWDTDKYNGNIADSLGNGLAEYTQANFLSENKMINLVTGAGYAHPAENDGFFDPTPVSCKDGTECYRLYFKKNQGESIDHLYAKGYLTKYVHNGNILEITDMLDDKCYADYADKLLPKAIGYSTKLINYFFRGTLGVTESAIVDGDTNGIKKITAKVVNTTPNNEEAPNGEVFAFARYKIPDATDYFYAIAASVTDTGGNEVTEIGRNMPTEIAVDFSNSPIPANVTELYLHVVYSGDLGNELATGVAIGMEKVTSNLYVLMHSGNYYVLFSVLTNSIVENLRNPRFDMVDEVTKEKLYPNAKEFFKFPEDVQNSWSSDFGYYMEYYLREIYPCKDILEGAPYPYHDNNQTVLAPVDNIYESGTPCPSYIPPGGNYAISCAGSSTGVFTNQFGGNGFWDFSKVASPKNEQTSYVSNYQTYDGSVVSTWDNRYTGTYSYYLSDPAVCDAMPIEERCACWIEVFEHRPYSSKQTIEEDRDETTTSEKTVKRNTPLGELYSISFPLEDSGLISTYHHETGFQCNTSGSCGLNYLGYFVLTALYCYDVPITNTATKDETNIGGYIWADENLSTRTAVHCESNSLLNYYVSFPVLKDMDESINQGQDVFVDKGHYVMAQLLRKEGLYDPNTGKFDASATTFQTRNPEFEGAINALISYTLTQTPTVKNFIAYFCIAGDKKIR